MKYLIGEEIPDAMVQEEAIWTEIDNAFSRPVSRSDDGGDYAPTQILAELFRDAGYDAIVFRSQFGKLGFNLRTIRGQRDQGRLQGDRKPLVQG